MKYLGLDLVRGEKISAADFLGPYLVLHPHQNRAFYVNQLKQFIVALGEKIFILCAFKDDENNEPTLVSFLVAYVNIDDQCYLPQCWIDEKNAPVGTASLLYSKLLVWAESMGCTKVVGELMAKGDRRAEAVFKRWGFKTQSYGISVDLTDEYTAKINQRLTGELKNYELLTIIPAVEELRESDGQSEKLDDPAV